MIIKKIISVLILFPAVLITAASAGNFSDLETKSPDKDDLIIAIKNNSGDVILGLSDTKVYMVLSDEILTQVNHHLEEEFWKNVEDFTNSRGEFIASPAEYLSESLIEYDLREVRSVELSGGELKFRYYDRKRISFEDVYTDKGKVLGQFSSKDADHFIRQFNQLKNS